MHLHSLILPSFLVLLSSTLAADPQQQPALQTLTLHYLPPSQSAKPLATLAFSSHDPSLSKLRTFTPPANSTSLTRIAVPITTSSGKRDYRTTLTSASSFHAPYTGRFRLVVSQDGEVLGASYHAFLKQSHKPTSREGEGDFDLVLAEKSPQITGLEPEKKVGVDGKVEGEVEEKTFLQRYWWVLIGAAVLAMAGSGDK